MSMKTFLIRLLGLVIIALSAGPLFALTMNLLLAAGMIPQELIDKAFGSALTMKCVYVWMGCLLLGFGSLFVQGNWRYLLYLSPLYGPSFFAILYTVMQ